MLFQNLTDDVWKKASESTLIPLHPFPAPHTRTHTPGLTPFKGWFNCSRVRRGGWMKENDETPLSLPHFRVTRKLESVFLRRGFQRQSQREEI